MSRPRKSIPSLCFHKKSKRWYYFTNGKRHYLGRDRAQAEKRYRVFVASGEPSVPEPEIVAAEGCTLAKALLAYAQFSHKNHHDSRTRWRVTVAVEAAVSSLPDLPINQFKARHLRAIREHLTAKDPPLARGYINALIRALKTAFAWLKERELIPAETLADVRSVRALEAGQGGRETGAVHSVEDWVIDSTKAECPPVVRSMIEVQRETGMRPGELCSMRRCEISTRPDEPIDVPGLNRRVRASTVGGSMIWLYAPGRHKNMHRGHIRVVAIGPEAQRWLAPILQRRALHINQQLHKNRVGCT